MANAAIQVFVSYARQDEALREELANHLSALKRNREIASWDNSCIEPGEEAEEQISRNLASAQIILLLVSSDYLASDELWRLEVEQAIARHQAGTAQVVPIILRPCYWQENTPFEGIAPLPKDSKPITRWEDQDEAFLDVVEGIRQAIKHLQQQSNFQPEESPYQGLEAFTRDKAKFFYGRQDIVDQLMKKLAETNFVPLIGISGIGKSSVVLAGLAPQLEAQGWQLLGPFKPGVKPLAALQEAFCSLFDQPEDKHEVYTLIETEGIERVLNLGPEDLIDPPELPKRDTARILLVIDQFEEIFTVCQSEDERTLFIQRITEISQKPNFPLAIVTTMRADFVESWLSYGSLIQAIQQQAVRLGSLEGEDLIKAIVEPAKKLGYCFGEGLLELILADVEQEKNCLPLLEFALTELWKDRDKKQRRLTATAYRQMGGVKGALNKRAEQIYRQLNDNQQDWVRRICLKLVRTGLDVKDISQRQLEEALLSLSSQPRDKKLIKRVINKLVTERLLVIVGDNYVELAYEDLMVGWCRFAGWREQNRDLRRLVQRVEDAEKDWKAKGKDDLYLLQGGILTEVREHWSTLEAEFTLSTQVFYQLSDKQEKKQVAFSHQLQAEVDLQKKAQKVMNLMSVRPLEAAAQAIQNMGESDRRLQGRMITSDYYAVRKIINTVKESGQFLGHMTDVRSVAFSPNSKAIVSGSSDRTVRLWDLQGNPIEEPFNGHVAPVLSVAFSPDGQAIVSSSSDRTVRLWDLQGNPIEEPFQGHAAPVLSLAFSPDGQTIVSSSLDRTVRLWDLKGNLIGKPFRGHSSSVEAVTFSMDGQIIASGSLDQTVRLWDLKGNPIGKPFRGHLSSVKAVAFSPNGQTIASSSGDKTIRLWDL
ncbi:MAG: TIR domain-containing protein, partial [Pseudanabaenales cyanobacterium]|nr:TIR domain-containing protein [Pseudanabaenales cyanobacterium]